MMRQGFLFTLLLLSAAAEKASTEMFKFLGKGRDLDKSLFQQVPICNIIIGDLFSVEVQDFFKRVGFRQML